MSKLRFVLKVVGLLVLASLLMTIGIVFLTVGSALMANGVETIFNIFHVHNVGGISYVF